MPSRTYRLTVVELERRDTPASPAGPGDAQPGLDLRYDVPVPHGLTMLGFDGPVTDTVVDVNGDSVLDDVVVAGVGGGPRIEVVDGASGQVVLNFFAYDSNFRGRVNLAIDDVDGDGVPDLVTGAGAGGGPRVRVFDTRTGSPKADFFAYAPDFRGGVQVATLDLDGRGGAEIITSPGAGGGPVVKVFDGATGAERLALLAGPPETRSGVQLNPAPAGYMSSGTVQLNSGFRASIDGTPTVNLVTASNPGDPLLRVGDFDVVPSGGQTT